MGSTPTRDTMSRILIIVETKEDIIRMGQLLKAIIPPQSLRRFVIAPNLCIEYYGDFDEIWEVRVISVETFWIGTMKGQRVDKLIYTCEIPEEMRTALAPCLLQS